jgi:hypothetical protein
MPITIPTIDDRRYQQLRADALARIPLHNPEWTNFNSSDPGVTLLELFAFLTESLLYRSNQIPERNRRKFLTLLGVPLQPAAAAEGLITVSNERGPRQVFTLSEGLEVRAGQVPFRTESGLDVLPIEAQAFYKGVVTVDQTVQDRYHTLYLSQLDSPTDNTPFKLYQTTAFPHPDGHPLDLGNDTIDGTLWIALLLRPTIDPPGDDVFADVRSALAGKTLTLGLVPSVPATDGRRLPPGGPVATGSAARLQVQMPTLPKDGLLPEQKSLRNAQYNTRTEVYPSDWPQVIDVTLPGAPDLALWANLDPLEAGTRDFPPSLENTEQDTRTITWLRLKPTAPLDGGLLWVGINATTVTQRAHVSGELLPAGTGEPDQSATLVRRPVLPGTVSVSVTAGSDPPETWQEIDDLGAAGPEVPVDDARLPPGATRTPNLISDVYTVDAEAGLVQFGDGLRGRRPPADAIIRADYDYCVGAAGNVGAGAINGAASLPAGLKVSNPFPSWGGADAEDAATGERQISRYLQNRDRLVNADDFETITLRTPGVAVGRVEVLAAFHPVLSPNLPGDAPGTVTVMAVPAIDPAPAQVPMPDAFVDAIACWLDPRRLVTTEVFVRRPDYQDIWVSIGLDVAAGASSVTVRDAVKAALEATLSPLPPPGTDTTDGPELILQTAAGRRAPRGWPLRKPVSKMDVMASALRVDDVEGVTGVLLAEGTGADTDSVDMTGLQLPRLAGLSVTVGDPITLDDLRGQAPPVDNPFIPVPIVPEEC